MNDWQEIQNDNEVVRRIEAPGGQRALVILRRRDSRFCYVELHWMAPWDDGDGPLDDGYWKVERSSGLFESQALAERDAFSSGRFKPTD